MKRYKHSVLKKSYFLLYVEVQTLILGFSQSPVLSNIIVKEVTLPYLYSR